MLNDAIIQSKRAVETAMLPAPMAGHMALIGNFPPRRCGIATFTSDLFTALRGAAPRLDCDVLAMTDQGAYAYPDVVTMSARQLVLSDYLNAARRLNESGVELICLQHEYGIFGGPAGAHILALLAQARAPLVTTFHTVLTDPDPDQRRVMLALLNRSSRVIVMAEKGKRILREVYAAPARKIVVIPHGVPDFPLQESARHKSPLGLAGHTTLLTFGLLAPSKGIEDMIRAMPAIVARHPDALYVVLGATHPHMVAREGESYRENLIRLADELGVADHVRFVNEYVDHDKLISYLAAADVYVTPYRSEAQITSGTLSYAVGLGKPVVSTPYWHAQELLAEERGVLTPFRDPAGFAAACIALLDDDVRRARIRRNAYAAGRDMIWPRVAQRHLQVFEEVRGERAHGRASKAPALASNLAGVERLTDRCGILQHSRYHVPDRAHGYCLDDNARALMLMHRLGEQGLARERGAELTAVYASFVQSAWNREGGCFRNFMSYERRWLETRGSDDSFGRGFWALGETALRAQEQDLRLWAAELAREALSAAVGLAPLRSRTFVALGLAALAAARPREAGLREALHNLAQDIAHALRVHREEGWVWFEPWLAYDNARVPEALLRVGRLLQAPLLIDAGLESLRWLCGVQTAPEGWFRPVATAALGLRHNLDAPFDQQPLEAAATIDACAAAFEASGDAAWLREAERAYAWFLGENDLGAPIGLPNGQCYDGLTPAGSNLNQGAESVLAFQFASVEIQRLQHSSAARPVG